MRWRFILPLLLSATCQLYGFTANVSYLGRAARMQIFAKNKRPIYRIPLQGIQAYLPTYNETIYSSWTLHNKMNPILWTLHINMVPKNGKNQEFTLQSFFAGLRRDYIYTYVINEKEIVVAPVRKLKHQKPLAEKASKHFLLADFAKKVRYSGEILALENAKTGEKVLLIDNSSGTYMPKRENLGAVADLLSINLVPADKTVDIKSINFTERDKFLASWR